VAISTFTSPAAVGRPVGPNSGIGSGIGIAVGAGLGVGATTGPVVATAVGCGAGDSSVAPNVSRLRSSVARWVLESGPDPLHEAAIRLMSSKQKAAVRSPTDIELSTRVGTTGARLGQNTATSVAAVLQEGFQKNRFRCPRGG
jgi:hypothetical protein